MKAATTPQEKIDLLALHKTEYAAPKKPVLVETKPATYLSITGIGQPGDTSFGAQIGALYSVAFTIKMTRKFSGKMDYTICKLEARWPELPANDKSKPWKWELLIRTPDFVSPEELAAAARKLIEKGQSPEVNAVRLTKLDEGPCVQLLHVGPYAEEARTCATMLAFADSKGFAPAGFHHEIYFSDPRRVPPERLRTILRQPVKKKA